MTMIEHLIDPRRLLLIWHASKPGVADSSRRFVVGTIDQDILGKFTLRYHHTEDVRDAHENYGFTGFLLYNYEPNKTESFSENLNHFLTQRTVTPTRADFNEYLRSHRIDPERYPSPSLMQLLACSGGKIGGDSFSFMPDLTDIYPPYECLVEIAGFRLRQTGMDAKTITSLIDEPVALVPEPDNAHDQKAIAIHHNGIILGCVPRGYLDSFTNTILPHYQVEAHIEKLNGGIDSPRVYMMVKVRAK
jgi:hypothetical protein